LDAGVTSIVDHSYGTFSEATSEASLQASIDTGARIWWCFGVHQIPNNFTIPRQFDVFRRLAESVDWNATPVELGISYDEFYNAPKSDVDGVIDLIR